MKSPILYKYTKFEYGLKTLNDKTIKITPPEELNDYFEMNLVHDVTFDRLVNGFITGEISGGAEHRLEELGLSNTVEDRTRLYEVDKDFLDEHFREQVKKVSDSIHYIFDQARDRTTVFSMSANPLNKLMWSHYADGYKGICIGFNFYESRLNERISKVKYSKFRQRLYFNSLNDPAYISRFIMDLVNTKSLDWAYEEEYRLNSQMDEEEMKKEIITETIDLNDIKEIIITPKFTLENIESLEKALHGKQYSHVKIKGLHLPDDGSYDFSLVPIKRDKIREYLFDNDNHYSPDLIKALTDLLQKNGMKINPDNTIS